MEKSTAKLERIDIENLIKACIRMIKMPDTDKVTMEYFMKLIDKLEGMRNE